MTVSGVFLRSSATAVRALQLLSSLIIFGIFSYLLVVLSKQGLSTATWIRAVEGISGLATLYTISGFFLTCCLGGIIFFAFVAILLDVAFVACFIAVASYTRVGAGNCAAVTADALGNGAVGFGNHATASYAPTLEAGCTLLKVVFFVSLVNVALFLLSATLQLCLGRHEQHQKRTAASPYASVPAPSRGFWSRNRDATASTGAKLAFWKRGEKAEHDAEEARLTTPEVGATAPEVGSVPPVSETTYGVEGRYQPVGENAAYYNAAGQDAYYQSPYGAGQQQGQQQYGGRGGMEGYLAKR